jgi:hypothetical protein
MSFTRKPLSGPPLCPECNTLHYDHRGEPGFYPEELTPCGKFLIEISEPRPRIKHDFAAWMERWREDMKLKRQRPENKLVLKKGKKR